MAIVRILRSEDESAFSAKRYRNTDTGETLSYRQAKKQLGEPLPTQRLVDRPGGRKLAQQEHLDHQKLSIELGVIRMNHS